MPMLHLKMTLCVCVCVCVTCGNHVQKKEVDPNHGPV